MLELLHALKQHINNDYEKVVKTTESSVYFERTKANNIKKIFRINFVDDNSEPPRPTQSLKVIASWEECIVSH